MSRRGGAPSFSSSRPGSGVPYGGSAGKTYQSNGYTMSASTGFLANPSRAAQHAANNNPALASFIEKCKHGSVIEADLATQEKEGMLTGPQVKHPLTGEMVDVWVGNYVLMSYGDGAVMGVPAHDERDFAFALKYGIAIKPVMVIEGQSFNHQQWQEWQNKINEE